MSELIFRVQTSDLKLDLSWPSSAREHNSENVARSFSTRWIHLARLEGLTLARVSGGCRTKFDFGLEIFLDQKSWSLKIMPPTPNLAGVDLRL